MARILRRIGSLLLLHGRSGASVQGYSTPSKLLLSDGASYLLLSDGSSNLLLS